MDESSELSQETKYIQHTFFQKKHKGLLTNLPPSDSRQPEREDKSFAERIGHEKTLDTPAFLHESQQVTDVPSPLRDTDRRGGFTHPFLPILVSSNPPIGLTPYSLPAPGSNFELLIRCTECS